MSNATGGARAHADQLVSTDGAVALGEEREPLVRLQFWTLPRLLGSSVTQVPP